MFTNNSNQDVEHHEQQPRSELDPLIQRDEKGPTKKEARIARAQFLALCWALFVIGWTDGSTGPLLPRIQNVYDVSFPLFKKFQPLNQLRRSGSERCLGCL